MISCKLQGGIGNQLFQIAATYALALRNKDICGFDFNNCHTPLQGNPSNKYKNNVFSKLNEINNYKFSSYYIEPKFSYTELPHIKDLMLNGYFQSEKYFIDYKDNIKDLFIIDKINSRIFLNSIRKDNIQITSIHVRRGDYVNLSHMHSLCSLEYYKEAIRHISNSIFVIVSDDLEWAKKNIYGENIYYSPFDNELDDFSLMTCCDNNIISNSTFSWWGAYLNNNINKKIIAPKIWFGPSGPKDIEDVIPNSWIKI
jgi:hypothetical protein